MLYSVYINVFLIDIFLVQFLILIFSLYDMKYITYAKRIFFG